MTKGYWIARVDVYDAEAYKKYVEHNGAAFKKFGGRFLVRGGKSAAEAKCDADGLHPVQRSWQLIELATGDVFIGDVGLAAELANAIDGDHVGVLQAGDCFGLVSQSVPRGRIGKLGGDKLDRDEPI